MDQLLQLNRRYDDLPELWRFPVVVAALVVVGAINMALTISARFPFGLLVLLAVLILAAIRVPYLLHPEDAEAHGPGASARPAPLPAHADLLHHWNHSYESFPELWRFQVIVWALVAVGAFNLALTISGRFPFALLVLLAIVGITAIRVPYVLGRGREGNATDNDAPATMALAPPERTPPPTVAPQPEEPATLREMTPPASPTAEAARDIGSDGRPGYVSVPPRQTPRPDVPPPVA